MSDCSCDDPWGNHWSSCAIYVQVADEPQVLSTSTRSGMAPTTWTFTVENLTDEQATEVAELLQQNGYKVRSVLLAPTWREDAAANAQTPDA